jgi:acyl carrier protein
MREGLEIKVRKVFHEQGVDIDDLTEEDLLCGETIGLDSLELVELFLECERAFQISISEERASEITTYGDLLTCLEEHFPNEVNQM